MKKYSIRANVIGVIRQLLSPILLNKFLERIMTDALEDHKSTVSIGGATIINLRFDDDTDGLAGEEEELAILVECLDKAYRKILRISNKDHVTREEVCAKTQQTNRTRRRSSDHRKETQIEVIRTCLPFIRSGQNHLASSSERGKRTRQAEKRRRKTTSRNEQA